MTSPLPSCFLHFGAECKEESVPPCPVLVALSAIKSTCLTLVDVEGKSSSSLTKLAVVISSLYHSATLQYDLLYSCTSRSLAGQSLGSGDRAPSMGAQLLSSLT